MKLRLGALIERMTEQVSIWREFKCRGSNDTCYGYFVRFEHDCQSYSVESEFPELLNEEVEEVSIEQEVNTWGETRIYTYLNIELVPITVSKERFERIKKEAYDSVTLEDFVAKKRSDNK